MCLIAICLISISATGSAQDEVVHSREASGGNAVLLEHYTATWCTTCATIDPKVNEFVGNKEDRLYRVALHPNDHDPFGSLVTTDRIISKQIDHQLVFPTFWLDNSVELQGNTGFSTLESSLVTVEAEKDDWIGIQMWWDSGPIDTHQIYIHIADELPMNSTVTIFRLENLKMTSEIANNGIEIHHDVATQSITFDRTGTSTEDASLYGYEWNLSTGNLPNNSDIDTFIFNTSGNVDGFVTIIETNGSIRSVIGISDSDFPRNTEKNTEMSLILLGITLASSTILIRRGNRQ